MTEPSTDAVSRTDDNLYAPPQAQIQDASAASTGRAPFYVVSTTKVAVLMFATFGLYPFYWFWRHWKMHKTDARLDIWPVARAVFSVFFTHALFREFDHRLTRQRIRMSWSPDSWATLYVVSVIAIRIANRLPDEMVSIPAALAVTMAGIVACTVSLVKAQRAANAACGDPAADANRTFTWANWIWIVLGGLFWLLTFVGMMLPEESP